MVADTEARPVGRRTVHSFEWAPDVVDQTVAVGCQAERTERPEEADEVWNDHREHVKGEQREEDAAEDLPTIAPVHAPASACRTLVSLTLSYSAQQPVTAGRKLTKLRPAPEREVGSLRFFRSPLASVAVMAGRKSHEQDEKDSDAGTLAAIAKSPQINYVNFFYLSRSRGQSWPDGLAVKNLPLLPTGDAAPSLATRACC